MSILKDEIEDHLEKSLLTKDNQTGFTKGGKKEDNLFMLQYLVGKAYKNKKPLILIAIDYSKAYDSLDRKKLIEALMEYKIHPHIIDIIAKLYQGDHTKIKIGDSEEKIDISSGIKQGCTLSTTLFKIVTYLIIQELENKGRGYKVDDIILQSLYFADDSILAAESIEDARHNLNILIEVSKKFGLNINRDKCNVLIYNNHEEIKEIDNIKVVENIKYLGITIDNKKDIFKTQKKYLIDSAQKYANMTYSIIKRSVNKMLIGKTFWKNVVLPTILQGVGLMTFTSKEIKKLQVIENGVYRKILGGNGSTPNSVLRGEIGCSLMKSRFIESKLMVIKGIQMGKNELTKQILKNVREDNSNLWNRQVGKFLREMELEYREISIMSKKEIKDKVKKCDTDEWHKNLGEKSSLDIYRAMKSGVKEEKCYDNRFASVLLFKARSNTLALNDRKRHKKEETECKLCKKETEDLIHFLIKCEKLDCKREKEVMEKYKDEDKEQMAGNILFGTELIETTKNMIESMWKYRNDIEKQIARQA